VSLLQDIRLTKKTKPLPPVVNELARQVAGVEEAESGVVDVVGAAH